MGPAPEVVSDQEPEHLAAAAAADTQAVEPPPRAAADLGPRGIDFTRLIASLVTAASAIFTVWSVWDLARRGAEEGQAVPHVVGLGAGTGVEAVWLWVLAIEWQQASTTGRVNPALTRTGWALAAGAAVVLAVHGVLTAWPMALLAVLPLAAKTGWHWLTALRCEQTRIRLEAIAAAERAAEQARREAERAAQEKEQAARERELALSTDLTEDEERELAEIRRRAAYARAKAKAENELTAAEAEADRLRQQAEADAERVRAQTEHEMRQEALQRQVDERMAAQKANADLLHQRFSLEQELRLMLPIGMGAAGGAQQVPDDPSGFGVPPVGGEPVTGFGAGLSQARVQGGGIGHQGGGIGHQGGGIVADLQGRPSPVVGGGGTAPQGGEVAADQGRRAPHHAARVAVGQSTRQRVLDQINTMGVEVKTAELARVLKMGRTTVRDHRNALRDSGYRVYPDSK